MGKNVETQITLNSKIYKTYLEETSIISMHTVRLTRLQRIVLGCYCLSLVNSEERSDDT